VNAADADMAVTSQTAGNGVDTTICYYQVIWTTTGCDAASNLYSVCDRREIIMNLADFLEAWWISIRPLLEVPGAVGRFERSPTDRPNPSCVLNLRRHKSEADLLVWESGEAELAMIEHDGSTSQQHFDDIRTVLDLSTILSRIVALMTDTSPR
jgi:hypothetical protein